MKKSLLALAALASVASVAHAEDGVQLYGILDVGVVQETHQGNFNPTFVTGSNPLGSAGSSNVGTTLGMMNGGESATRWGIKGSEDLGGGRSAFFKLESGFSVANGQLANSGLNSSNAYNNAADTSLNGQLFGRAAQVGISDRQLGTVTLGRMNNLMLDIIAGGYDPVNAQMFSPINFSGSYGGGGETDNGRVDNALKYTKDVMGVKINALYGFGGMSNSYTARSQSEFSLGYEKGRFGVQAAYEIAHDASSMAQSTTAGASAGYINATFYDLRSSILTAKYDVTSQITVKAGWENRNFSAPSNLTADKTLSSLYGYQINTYTGYSAANSHADNTYWVGVNYMFSQKSKVSIGYYTTNTDSYATTAAVSARYASALYDYYLSKRTSFYAGVMNVTKTGVNEATAPSSWWTYGAGVVHKF